MFGMKNDKFIKNLESNLLEFLSFQKTLFIYAKVIPKNLERDKYSESNILIIKLGSTGFAVYPRCADAQKYLGLSLGR